MSRKDYVAVAGVIAAVNKSGGDPGTMLAVAERLAHVFEADNRSFDPVTFYAACDFESVVISGDGTKPGVPGFSVDATTVYPLPRVAA